MIKIEINDFTNGYSLSVYDDKDGYLAREIADTKVEILNAMLTVVSIMARDERKRLEAAL